MARVVDGGVRYACGSCRGHLVGLAPFTHEHADGRHLWVASAEAPETGTCPICRGAMRAPAGAPDGLLVCRRCEQVWVPAAADGQLPAAGPAAGAPPPPRAAHPDECPECGAPWAPDPGGRCRYCREQLSAGDQQLVVIERPARFGGPLLGIAVGIAEGLVEGSSW